MKPDQLSLISLFAALAVSASAQNTTSFTYQGRLNDTGGPPFVLAAVNARTDGVLVKNPDLAKYLNGWELIANDLDPVFTTENIWDMAMLHIKASQFTQPGHFPFFQTLGSCANYHVIFGLSSLMSGLLLATYFDIPADGRADCQPSASGLPTCCTNRELIAIDQDPLVSPAIEVRDTNDLQVLSKTLIDGSKAVGVFYHATSGTPINATLSFSEVSLPSVCAVRDVFANQFLGYYTNTFATAMPVGDLRLYRFIPASTALPVLLIGDAAGAVNLNASSLASGTVPAGRLPDLSATYERHVAVLTNAYSPANAALDGTQFPLATVASGVTAVAGPFLTTNTVNRSYSYNAGGMTNLNASALASGMVAASLLGARTASSNTYLRGDQTWSALAGLAATNTSGELVLSNDLRVVNAIVTGSNYVGAGLVVAGGFGLGTDGMVGAGNMVATGSVRAAAIQLRASGVPTLGINLANCGSGATAAFTGPVTNDNNFSVALVTGTSPATPAPGPVWTNTFSCAKSAVPKVLMLPETQNACRYQYSTQYMWAVPSTTNIVVWVGGGMPASTSGLTWSFLVFE